MALLRILSTGVEERLDLAVLVGDLAQEQRWSYRRRLRRLGRRLEEGTPLADALEQTPGVLSDEQTLCIRYGTQLGTLRQCFQHLVGRSNTVIQQLSQRSRQLRFYLGFVCFLFVMTMAFMVVEIFPSYQKIFDDFEIDAGRLSDTIYEACQFVVNEGPVLCLLLIFLLLLLRFGSLRRFLWHHLVTRFFGSVAKLRVSSVLEYLAITQQAGRPMAGSLSTLARYHFDPTIRQKLLFVRNEVEQGAPVWKAMSDARLISIKESQAMESASKAGTTVWTLQRLAEWKRRSVARRFDVYLDLLQPLVVLGMAALVMVAALASLGPLFELLKSLC